MAKKEITYYQVPDKYWYRIHFVRPRFKSNIENVLLYMANECCRIPKCSCEEYSRRYFNAIKMFPGNIDMADKTLHNWRTEIPALFGFYKEDKEADTTETSKMAIFLHENQDLTQFLRLFLHSFQFPGGHMKPQDLKDIIHHDIRFKPARTIIQVLMSGNRLLADMGIEKEMSISAEEATYCIFNDTRVTSGKILSEQVAQTIIDNRQNKVRYYNNQDPKVLSLTGQARSKGDITRYAGDILDYMEIANLLEKHNGYYFLKGNELISLDTFANDTTWFSGYDTLYKKKDIETVELSKLESMWFEYINNSMNPNLFKTDLRTVIGQNEEIDVVFEDRIKDVVASDNRTTKDIGNLGEAIVCGHEKMRLKINGYDEFVKLVQVVDSPTYHPGFDIDSFEADGTENHRYIEVKTTISKQRIQMYGFHMSPNEWRVAETIKEHYCVYRLMLSEKEKILFILRNPVALYKSDKIEAEPRNGMEITFSTEHFESTQLLSWKK
ncbi:protein NO VEIN domain-containing protein [Porphyromonas sp.]